MSKVVVREATLCECGCAEPVRLGRRFVHGHNRKVQGTPLSTRLRYSVEDRGYETPCWIWQGNTWRGYAKGYHDRRNVRVHRYMYEREYGPIPDGLFPDHLCRQRACIRPDHLELVTNQENILRGDMAKKLTQADVDEIRRLRAEEGWTYTALGERFGVDKALTRRIVLGEAWRKRRPE